MPRLYVSCHTVRKTSKRRARDLQSGKESNIISSIVTVRIELRDSDPLIWRAVETPTSVTLRVFHEII
jgi:hypothetical protein